MNGINNQYKTEVEKDWDVISGRKDNVIAGFLNIGIKDGWNQDEGEQHVIGWSFTRFMFAAFCEAQSSALAEYRDIIERVKTAFLSKITQEGLDFPPRAFPDSSICGWARHSITYLMGYLGSKKSENGPFFEVVINSAKPEDSDYCFPFKVSVLLNKQEAIARKKQLRPAKEFADVVAYPLYFHSRNTKTISEFKTIYRMEYAKDPGKNAMRILNALEFLEGSQMQAQVIGNCWMKQNERLVLPLLFIEIVTHRPELSHEKCWELAISLYKKWITYTKGRIEGMLNGSGISLDLALLARKKLNQQKPPSN